jgi:hypothetical protein
MRNKLPVSNPKGLTKKERSAIKYVLMDTNSAIDAIKNTTAEEIQIQPALLKGLNLTLNFDLNFVVRAHPDDDHAPPSSEPPPLAEFLLRFCARTKYQQTMLGDLNETFTRDCAEFGRKRAIRRYWAEALRSLLPLAGRMIGRFVKWAAIVHLLS